MLEELSEEECKAIRGRSGHSASKTLYGTALATGDTELAAWLKSKLIEVAGEKAANDQYNAQFEEGWKEEENKKWDPIFKQLNVVTEAIRTADLKNGDIVSSGHPAYEVTVKAGSTVETALLKFRSLLDATLKDGATTGRHFNPDLLYQAFKIYDEHYHDYFGNDWEDPRALAFWQLVIGYTDVSCPSIMYKHFLMIFLLQKRNYEKDCRRAAH